MAILLSGVVVGVIALSFAIFQPFLLSALWAAALVSVSYRAHHWLEARLRGRRVLAALLMTLVMLALVVGPICFLVFAFVGDAAEIYREVASGGRDAMLHQLEGNWAVEKVLGMVREFGGKEVHVRDLVDALLGKLPLVAAAAVQNAASWLFAFLAGLFFVILCLYYFYKDGPVAVRVLRELLPLSEEDRDAIFGEIGAALNAAVVGGLLTAIAQGFLGFIILFILGVGQPVLWSFAMAVASLVPLVGTAIVWVPMAGIFLLRGEVNKALVLAGYGTIVIGMADNLLRPLLVGRQIEVHPLLLFFGILGGIAMFGFAGIILGPVMVVFLQVTTRMFRREFRPAQPTVE